MEDQAVYLLAGLPESYNVLVTALKANENVPKLEVVIEHILDQKRKSKDRSETNSSTESAMTSRKNFRCTSLKCHYCRKLRHIKKNYRDFKAKREGWKEKGTKFQKATTTVMQENSDSESPGLVVTHALSVLNSNEQCAWIIDLGATCHMCQNSKSFTTLHQLGNPINVMLGDR